MELPDLANKNMIPSPISISNKQQILFGGISMPYAIQLTLEQHGFQLHGSTYMQIFFNNKSYCTTPSEVG